MGYVAGSRCEVAFTFTMKHETREVYFSVQIGQKIQFSVKIVTGFGISWLDSLCRYGN